MSDIVIEDVDSVNIRVRCERSIAKELSDFFTFKVPGHAYMPAYRKRIWDGQIKLYNMFSQTIYGGLERYVLDFAKERGYSVNRGVREDNPFTSEQVEKYIKEFLKPSLDGKVIDAHEHQINAITHALQKDRALLVSPTGSGKSLIIYALVRYYLDKIPSDRKILIVVPTTSLVSQLYSDFDEYSSVSGWKTDRHCHKVMSGLPKDDIKRRVIISTWQSIHTQSKDFFDKFGAVFGDECHLFKAKSLTSIMTKLEKCPIRIGTTGTLDGTLTHRLVIEGLFGPVHQVTKTKILMKRKLLSDLKIDAILLKHDERIRQEMKRCAYQDEIDYIVTNEARNEFICGLAANLKGNTLILFQFVEKHGKKLNEMMKMFAPTKKVFFVHGGTDADQREEIRKIVEGTEDSIIIASYGTFSTGVSIRRLHNIVFSSPSKSRIRVLQSIGRQLRKSEHKDIARLYDLADDISWKKYKNHTLRHFEERLKIYEGEGFEHKIVNIVLKHKEDADVGNRLQSD
jgi:superfamily II DNA or RNA helicase